MTTPPDPLATAPEPSLTAGLTEPIPRPRALLWRMARYLLALGALAAGLWAISGKTGELEGATGYLTHIRFWWVAVAVCAEALSYLAMAAVQQDLLLAGDIDLGTLPATGISLGGSAIQYSLPGGTLFYIAYVFRQYRRRGADDLLAGWTVLAFNAVTFVTLALLAVLGLSFAVSAGNAYDLAEAILAIALVALLLVIACSRWDRLVGPFTAVVRLAQRTIHRPDPRVDATETVTGGSAMPGRSARAGGSGFRSS